MNDHRPKAPEWFAFFQLIHDLINGTTRRNKFSADEMQLLLDVGEVRLRKSARAELLRRYLKAVQKEMSNGGLKPTRFLDFCENDPYLRAAKSRSTEDLLLKAG